MPGTPAICEMLVDPLGLRKEFELKDKRLVAYREYLGGALTVEEYANVMVELVAEEVDPFDPDG